MTEAKQELVTYPQPQKTSIPALSRKNKPANPQGQLIRNLNPRRGKKDKNHAWDIKENQKGICLLQRKVLAFRRDREEKDVVWGGT